MLERLRAGITGRGLSVTLIVMAGVLLLIPPALLADRFSTLEVSLVLLGAAALTHWRDTTSAPSVAVPTALATLLLLMTLSTLWSSASWFTLRDSIAYIALTATAWLLVKRGGLYPIILGVLAAGVLVLLMTAVVWLVDPAAIFYNRTPALESIYRSRNEFGAVMLQCLPAAIAYRIRVRGGVLLQGAVVAVFLGAIHASQSKTSIIAALLVLAAWGIFVLIKRSRPIGIALIAVTVVTIAFAFANSAWVFRLLGKDDTLNGRLGIWEGLIDLLPQSPLIGFGFFREWPGGSSQSVAVAESSGIAMIHAHNELLSWLTAIGIIGLVIVLALYGFVYWAGWRIHRKAHVEGTIWLLLTMVMLNARGLTETSETNPQGWFIFVLAIFACARYVPATLAKPLPNSVLWRWNRPSEQLRQHRTGMEVS